MSAAKMIHVPMWALMLAVLAFMHQAGYSQTDDDGPLFEIEFDRNELLLPCPSGCTRDTSANSCSDEGNMEISVRVTSKRRGPRDTKIWYEYEPEKGSVTETSDGILWNLEGAVAGKHWLKVKMNEDFETVEAISKSVEIGTCDCICKTACATLTLAANKNEVVENQVVMLRAVQAGYFSDSVRLRWNVENGTILSGQGSNIVRVRAGASGDGDLLVNLELTQPGNQCTNLYQLRVPIAPNPANEEDQ